MTKDAKVSIKNRSLIGNITKVHLKSKEKGRK